MAIEVGTKAPDFTLKSKSTGDVTDVTLSSNFGSKNTVLLFVPLAFTGVCTGELCDITAGLGAYTDLNADVIGISVDSPFAQEAWAQKENIGITLASDLNKSVSADYGVLLDDLMGFGSVAARAAFVIDKDGLVQYSEQTADPEGSPELRRDQGDLGLSCNKRQPPLKSGSQQNWLPFLFGHLSLAGVELRERWQLPSKRCFTDS